jgi:type I restriction enzyme M protein
LSEPMEWAYQKFGDRVYSELKTLGSEILAWCEQNGIELNAKKRAQLTDAANWKKHLGVMQTAQRLMEALGTGEHRNFNRFCDMVEAELKSQEAKLAASELNLIYNAMGQYDETAEKVVKRVAKLKGEKLDELLHHLDCTVAQLPDHGYYPTGKASEYITYEAESDLRDTESIPLRENIYDYYLREVKPHVSEAWMDMDKTKIGYEISFNKYFYRHAPLRTLQEVTEDILALEQASDGLLADILSL